MERPAVRIGEKLYLPNTLPRKTINRVLGDLTFTDPKAIYAMKRGWKVDEEDIEIRAYTKKNGVYRVPRGYLPKLQKLLKNEDIKYVDNRTRHKPRPIKNNIKLFPHQESALTQLRGHTEGILQAPCGSGKSIMILKLACELGQPTLVLVHTIDLLRQWKRYIEEFTEAKPGLIHGEIFDIQDITLASVMTLARRELSAEFRRYFGLVVLDEAHHAPAYSFSSVLTRFRAGVRLGVTATPRRDDGLQGLLNAVAGPTVAVVSQDELYASGFAVRPSVFVIRTKFRYPFADFDEQGLYEEIEVDARRAQRVARVILENDGRSILVLSRRIAHLDNIYDQIFEDDPAIRAKVLTGRVNKNERERILKRLRSGRIKVVLATQLADEGLDIPRLDMLVLAFPGSGTTKLEQQIGRIMRKFPGKKNAWIFDIVDSRVPMLVKRFYKRKAFYKRMKYPITFV